MSSSSKDLWYRVSNISLRSTAIDDHSRIKIMIKLDFINALLMEETSLGDNPKEYCICMIFGMLMSGQCGDNWPTDDQPAQGLLPE